MSDIGNVDFKPSDVPPSSKFKWSLQNISSLPDNTIIKSPICVSGHYRWYVMLKFIKSAFINLNLSFEHCTELRRHMFCVGIYGANGEEYLKFEKLVQLPGCLIDLKCNSLPNDIVLYFRIKNFETDDTVSRQYSADFRRILNHSLDADLTLRVEGRDIKAHKAILSARSPVFERMFLNNWTESSSRVVVIDDIDSHTIEMLLKYLYTGVYDDFSHDAWSLYYAADKYEVLELRGICGNVLLAELSVASVISVLTLADRHCDSYLFRKAAHFIGFHLDEISSTKEWQILETKQPVLIQRVMKSYYCMKDIRIYKFMYKKPFE